MRDSRLQQAVWDITVLLQLKPSLHHDTY